MSAVYARCIRIRRFLYTLSRVEISVYAVCRDTCGRLYPYIFVYADVTVSEPVFFRARFSKMLNNPLRCPDTNRIRVDGRIRFVYATCGRRYFCIRIKKICGYKISGYVWTGPQSDKRLSCTKQCDHVAIGHFYFRFKIFHFHKLTNENNFMSPEPFVFSCEDPAD